MAKKKNVDVYQLVCTDCKSRNYVQRLSRENKGLKVKKYCPQDRKHTEHSAKKA